MSPSRFPGILYSRYRDDPINRTAGCRIGYYHSYGVHSPGKSNIFGGTYLPSWRTSVGIMLMYTRGEAPNDDIGCQSST